MQRLSLPLWSKNFWPSRFKFWKILDESKRPTSAAFSYIWEGFCWKLWERWMDIWISIFCVRVSGIYEVEILPSRSLKYGCAQKYYSEIQQLIESMFFLIVLIGLKSTHFHSWSLCISREYLMRTLSFCQKGLLRCQESKRAVCPK